MREKHRFWDQVVKTEGCWIWLGVKNPSGHGRFWWCGKFVMAYIWSWERLNGPVPENKELHHKCENPSCVRPEHLEPKTRKDHCQEHMKLRLACRRGHEHAKYGVYLDGEGRRHCRECRRMRRGFYK